MLVKEHEYLNKATVDNPSMNHLPGWLTIILFIVFALLISGIGIIVLAGI